MKLILSALAVCLLLMLAVSPNAITALPSIMSGDCSMSVSGAITCTKTNNVAFATVATSGSASDLATGTLAALRGGGLVLVEEHTASSSAELDFTTCISATYDDYQVDVVQLVPATNAVTMSLQFSTNGGSTYDTTSIYDQSYAQSWNSSSSLGGYTSTGLAIGNVSNDAHYGLNGKWALLAPGGSGYKIVGGPSLHLHSTNGLALTTIIAAYKNTSAVNAFRLLASSGNLASGTVRCSGVAK